MAKIDKPDAKCFLQNCSETFPEKRNKKFCSISCRNKFHNDQLSVDNKTRYKEIARIRRAGKTLELLASRMELLKMSFISRETLELFDIPLLASTYTGTRKSSPHRLIKYYGLYGLEPINDDASNYRILQMPSQ